jgi:hypothetical protein
MIKVDVVEIKPKPDMQVVAHLEALLAQARTGDLQQIAVVTFGASAGWEAFHRGHVDMLISGLWRMLHRIMREHT